MGMVSKGFGNVPLKDLTMEMKRVVEFEESLCEDCGWVNLVFSRVSLSKFSLEALSKSWVYEYIYSRVRRNVKSHILPNRVFWQLNLATGLSREFKPRANGLASLRLLSWSEQLARRFSFWHAWHVCFNLAACSYEPPARSSRESLLLCTHLSNSSHSHTHITLTWFPPKYRVSNC